MKKFMAILFVAIILMPVIGSAAAQDDNCTEEDCDDCETCRSYNYYYILVAGLTIFLVFFYLRNRAPQDPEKPPKDE